MGRSKASPYPGLGVRREKGPKSFARWRGRAMTVSRFSAKIAVTECVAKAYSPRASRGWHSTDSDEDLLHLGDQQQLRADSHQSRTTEGLRATSRSQSRARDRQRLEILGLERSVVVLRNPQSRMTCWLGEGLAQRGTMAGVIGFPAASVFPLVSHKTDGHRDFDFVGNAAARRPTDSSFAARQRICAARSQVCFFELPVRSHPIFEDRWKQRAG